LPTDSSAEIMSWLNDEILAANLEQHVAMFLGLINRGRDMLEYTNAGHFPGTILRTEQETVYLELGGLPLGISPVPGYDFQRVSLPVPSELVMFSDGVFEILGEESLEAKEKHLLSLVKGTSGEVDSLAENLGLHEVAEVPDDIAIFTVAKTG
ncbi:MAG: serine/threonine-protein phosphatase, partial [Pseudomonadales bacterium]|nr:serine/threonine-protein phosphatase [Pseudomonadales bacterium]